MLEINIIDRDIGPDSLPKVLVLLATYNGAKYLEEQIDSILSQQGVSVSVTVSDDASTDGTLSFLQEHYGGRSNVQVMSSECASGSAGANFRRLFLAREIQSFEWIALADQDDVWLPEKLKAAIQQLEANKAVGYSSTVEAFWADGRSALLTQSKSIRTADFLFEGAGQGCTFVLRGDFFNRVCEFCRAHSTTIEKLHYHDWLIYLLARAWQKDWYFDSTPWLRYRQHAANEIGARGNIAAIRRRLRLIRSGWYSRQICAASEIYLSAGGSDYFVLQIVADLIDQPAFKPVSRRVNLAYNLFQYGRRRMSDRLILSAAALAGWI